MMTDRQHAERVEDLLRKADRLRVPGHRHTVETFLGEIGEIREGLRRLHRDLTGHELPREPAPCRSVLSSFSPGSIAGTRAVVTVRRSRRAIAARA